MKFRIGLVVKSCLISAMFASLLPVFAIAAQAGFVARDADVNGQKLHYTMGGHGPAVVLLHGFAETSRMWAPILPVLADGRTPEARRIRSSARASAPTLPVSSIPLAREAGPKAAY